MGDHFVLLMDRLLTESTLEAAIESRNRLMQAATSLAVDNTKVEKLSHKVEFGDKSSTGKLLECRICQDEDIESNMETPCSCCGSLKYAHRRCVQRWCNEKGNTICEICHQQFKPGYTAPSPQFRLGQISMTFRRNWETSRRNLPGPRFIAAVSNDQHNFLNSEYDEYSASTTRSVVCCRSVAIIFMILLILRHTLPFILTETSDITFPLLMLIFLRTAGVILPICVIIRAVTAIQRRRHQEEPPSSFFSSPDEESGHSTLQAQPHVNNV